MDKFVLVKVGEKETTLSSLVSDLSKEQGYNRDRVMEGLMRMQSSGTITISEREPYSSLGRYALSPHSFWFVGAVIATLLSLALISVTSGVTLYLRYVFGGLLILFLPGYSVTELLYSKKDLEELTTVVLSIGLSLALVPLVGLVLNYTPFGIRVLPIAFSLAGLTIVLLLLALRRKHLNYKVSKRVVK
jgi:hypothetical protein